MVTSALQKGQAEGKRRWATVLKSRNCSHTSGFSAPLQTHHNFPYIAAHRSQLPREGEQGGPVKDAP